MAVQDLRTGLDKNTRSHPVSGFGVVRSTKLTRQLVFRAFMAISQADRMAHFSVVFDGSVLSRCSGSTHKAHNQLVTGTDAPWQHSVCKRARYGPRRYRSHTTPSSSLACGRHHRIVWSCSAASTRRRDGGGHRTTGRTGLWRGSTAIPESIYKRFFPEAYCHIFLRAKGSS